MASDTVGARWAWVWAGRLVAVGRVGVGGGARRKGEPMTAAYARPPGDRKSVREGCTSIWGARPVRPRPTWKELMVGCGILLLCASLRASSAMERAGCVAVTSAEEVGAPSESCPGCACMLVIASCGSLFSLCRWADWCEVFSYLGEVALSAAAACDSAISIT